ncbi:tyrosine-type recombinase/integrase [Anaerovoracaceae bacterium SGI.195]
MKKRKDSKGRVLKCGETERKNGSYSYRWVDSNGKRRTIYATTLNDLRYKEEKIILNNSLGIFTSNIKLNDLITSYLKSRTDLKQSTLDNYWFYYHHSIENSQLGNMAVANIKKSHIKNFYLINQKAGLSNGSIAILHKIIHPSLQVAVDDDIILKNPASNSMRSFPSSDSKVKFALTVEEEKEFLERVKLSKNGKYFFQLYVLLLATGLRIGEALGLTISDIDFENNQININHQLHYRRIHGKTQLYCDTSTKTKAGMRIIPMTEYIKSILVEQINIVNDLNIDKTFELNGFKDFLFISNFSKSGKPIYPSNVRRNMRIVSSKNDNRDIQLPIITPHILRHTACTRMVESGLNIKAIQSVMGHKSIKMTLNLYTHLDNNTVRNELSKLHAYAKFTPFFFITYVDLR